MTKAFDQAQELEGIERESLIAAQRKELVRVTYSHCEDCGEEIAKERQLIGGVKRCIECQEIYELNKKRGLR